MRALFSLFPVNWRINYSHRDISATFNHHRSSVDIHIAILSWGKKRHKQMCLEPRYSLGMLFFYDTLKYRRLILTVNRIPPFKQRYLLWNLHRIVLELRLLGSVWQTIEHLRRCNLTWYEEEAHGSLSQWMPSVDNYDSTSLWKLNTLKIPPLWKEKGDTLENAHTRQPMGIGCSFCGLSIKETVYRTGLNNPIPLNT